MRTGALLSQGFITMPDAPIQTPKKEQNKASSQSEKTKASDTAFPHGTGLSFLFPYSG